MSNKKFLNHIKKNDKTLYYEITKLKRHRTLQPQKDKNLFQGLCKIIIGQQVSSKAATAIWLRVKKFFRGNITYRKILNRKHKQLRELGLSQSKTETLFRVAKSIQGKELNLSELSNLENEEIISRLCEIKGIGPWSCEMFLIFCLARPNRISFGDLALRKAMKGIYNMKELPTEKQFFKKANKWSPYRTYGALALWAWLDPNDPWDNV